MAFNTPKISKQIIAVALIGNSLEHYDSALYGLLAPILAPLFFPHCDSALSLILTYGLIPLGVIAKPIGALTLGKIGDHYGRKRALALSLWGMSLTTVAMGLLPTYCQIGIAAPCLLIVLKIIQSGFIASESVGGAIYLLEHTSAHRQNQISSIYGISTIVGILIASGVVTLLAYFDFTANGWRAAFWLGSLTAISGAYVRARLPESPELLEQKKSFVFLPFWHMVWQYRRPCLVLLLLSGFSYATYSAAFVFMNSYAPQVAAISFKEIMLLNTHLLFLDISAMLLFGWLADRLGAIRLMRFSALAIGVLAPLLFAHLDRATFDYVVFVRVVIILCGVGFSAPFSAVAQKLLPAPIRYSFIALVYSLGSQLIGATLTPVCLWLYRATGAVAIPGIYLSLCAAATIWALAFYRPYDGA